MTKIKIREIIELINSGWRAYSAVTNSSIYLKLNCSYAPEKTEDGQKKKKSHEPFWFVRADSFICVGCPRRCALSRPEGFMQPLPINYEERTDTPFSLTPGEMVQRKSLLRVDEVAYCLNIKERTVYDWIAEGKLRKTKENPVRVPAPDVLFYMSNFEE